MPEEPPLGARYCATNIAVWGNNKTKARTGELGLHVSLYGVDAVTVVGIVIPGQNSFLDGTSTRGGGLNDLNSRP